MSISLSTSRRVWVAVLFLLAGALVVHWWNRFQKPLEQVTVQRRPVGVMGTSSRIIAVVPGTKKAQAELILDAAERDLRRSEALFSTWIEASEMSRFNAMPVGVAMNLSNEVADLLDWSHEMHRRTGGAFDITAGPLIEAWRLAADRGKRPSRAEIEAARLSSGWDDFAIFTVSPTGIRRRETAALDVDGIAKGYAIDLALDALMQAGAVGGMVEVGGDLRVAGRPPDGDSWPIGIRSPFAAEQLGSVDLEHGAVCTSGSYARPVTIGDGTYSHIIDPRTGEPVNAIASVTVVAADAATADAWATALSVLGQPGLDLIADDPEVEALIIIGSPDESSAVASGGFPQVSGTRAIQIERLP